MAKVIIIGAGGVGTVVAHKCAQHPEVFSEIVIASRTRSKCDAVAAAIGKPNVTTDTVDADSVEQLCELFRRHKPLKPPLWQRPFDRASTNANFPFF